MYTRKQKVTAASSPAEGVLVTPPAPGSLAAAPNPTSTPRKRRQRKPKMLTIVEAFVNQIRSTEPRAGILHEHKDGSKWIEPAWLVYTTPEQTYVYMANSGNLIYTSTRLQFMQWMRIGPQQWVLMSQDMAKAS